MSTANGNTGSRILSSLALGVQAAFREIRAQPLRSGLSIAGVAMAVGALSAILSLMGGLRDMVRESVADMGGAGRMMLRTSDPDDALQARTFSRSPGLQAADGEMLGDSTGQRVVALRTAGGNTRASYLGKSERVFLMGCDRDYLLKDVSAIIYQGEMPSKEEWQAGRRVAVVGWTLGERWGEAAAARGKEVVGSEIVIDGIPYTIAGTFRFKRANWGRNGITVAIPYAAWSGGHQKPFSGMGALQMRVENPESTEVILPRLQEWMLGAHRGAEDFSVETFAFLAEITRMVANISVLLGVVAALSLSVGALGIFNTMLAGYHDRVREIGVRKALGARRAQIFAQFLVESIVLSSLGGCLGLSLGLLPPLFGDALYAAFTIRPVFDLQGALQAFGISVLVGVLAGLWPAIRAARLNPVDALRYE